MTDATETPLHSASLLVRPVGGVWSAPTTTSYGTERQLRDLIAANPSIVPGVSDPAASAVTELGVPPIGRIDVVIVESSGAITVCEAKLATNADIRRTVVGQVFAYAAGLNSMTLEQLDAAWAARGSGQGLAESILGADCNDTDRSAFLSSVRNTLATGRFRLLLAVDSLTDELRRIVTYLSGQLGIDVVALELAYSRHGDFEVLVPRTWGGELATQRRNNGVAGQAVEAAIDESTIANQRAAAESAALGFGSVVERVLREFANPGNGLYSGNAQIVDPVLWTNRQPKRQPVKFIISQSVPGIRVCFQWCVLLPATIVSRALEILEEDPPIAPHVAGVRADNFRRRPLLPFKGCLDAPSAVDTLIKALHVLLDDDMQVHSSR